eukprot:10537145-Lingulodinium_polyedra.AAC.1
MLWHTRARPNGNARPWQNLPVPARDCSCKTPALPNGKSGQPHSRKRLATTKELCRPLRTTLALPRTTDDDGAARRQRPC